MCLALRLLYQLRRELLQVLGRVLLRHEHCRHADDVRAQADHPKTLTCATEIRWVQLRGRVVRGVHVGIEHQVARLADVDEVEQALLGGVALLRGRRLAPTGCVVLMHQLLRDLLRFCFEPENVEVGLAVLRVDAALFTLSVFNTP